MKGVRGRAKGERRPTVLPEQFADYADEQAKHWTAIGTIGRALERIEPKMRIKVLEQILANLKGET